MAKDLDILRHQEWLGLLQPVGLVVSPPALIKAQAVIDRGKLVDLQEQLREVISTEAIPRHKDDGIAWIENFPAFTHKVLDWVPQDLVSAADLPDSLSAVLPSYGETLRPTYGVKDPDSDEWILLIQELAPGLPLDEDDLAAGLGQGWKASFQAKFERLLRETGIAAGLLVNGTDIRLVYAPSGESSGYLTFPVQAMTEVPGRLILGALALLLGADRLFNVPENQRLNRLLMESRNYQAEVSTKLAEQVLDALWELLRGFQAADAAVNGKLLAPLLTPLSRSGRGAGGEGSQHIYGGLITTLMRLVFLLYAEDEGLMPDDEVYQRNYAVSGLYEKLREDAGSYPDTMDQRYGAWATLLSLFRLVYDGGGAYEEYLPARHGQLFDPDEYPFLEGRSQATQYQTHGRVEAPRIPDRTIYLMLDKLLMLDGERLSYRALDVEQIGSVYEAIMGYEVEVAEGRSIAVKPKDVVVNVEALLAAKGKDRAKVLKDEAECKVTGKGLTALKQAETMEGIVAALERRVSSRTPNLLAPGSLYLQPGEERRRTGSHYTPRKLTQPIVETTLRPVLEALGPQPTPDQILALKVCDLAMGSAAFLVEACRQLAEKLVEAWDHHGNMAAYLPGVDPHPPTPSPRTGEGEPGALLSPSPPVGEGLGMRETEGEPDRWEVPDAVRQKMVEVARQFRKEPTQSEEILWQAIRGRKLEGYKFRRQQPIGSFVVDFFCPAEKLIVEVDGGIHESQRELDNARQELLEFLGLRFVRLSSNLVENDLPTALETIRAVFKTLTPSPSPMQGEGDRTLAPFSLGGRRAGDEGEQPRQIISDIEPILYARRLVAQRCLYGVDKNPFAVNLAKLSLWLVTLAKDQPFTFVDHALKCGDSLVGLTRAEIGSFGKDPTEDLPLFKYLKEKVDRAKSYRAQIQALDTRTDQDAEAKLAQLHQAEQELEEAKLIGDVKIAAFFDGKSKKDRDAKLSEYGDLVRTWRQGNPPHPLTPPPTGGEGEPERTHAPLSLDGRGAGGEGAKLTAIRDSLRNADKPITPFNWEIEFPEVFDPPPEALRERENPGFDAIVGNPPFAGKNNIINSNPEGYLDWLKEVHPESHGNADLVAHFFRRAFNITRKGGSYGLISTNTIAQGDTRSSGLRFICNNGGTIYNAQKRVKWPGLAAVVISVVNIFKGDYSGKKLLDGRETDAISAFLFHSGGNDDPHVVLANKNKSFQGSIVLGMGFTFDDSNANATPIAEMHRLIAKDSRNAERIFPYIGGEEVNSNPTHTHHRYVINFGEMAEKEAREYPDLMAIVEEKVKPARLAQKREIRARYWWRFGETTPALFRAIAECDRVLVIPSSATKYLNFVFLPSSMIFSHKLIVFPLSKSSHFAALQSRIHLIWTTLLTATMKDDLTYNPSDCFQTFPFPGNWETDPTLEAIGKTYYEYRADLMVRNNQGLTDTYNRFHNPSERDPNILKLRDLHEQMDRAVLTAYGWPDIDTTCGFALDYLDADPDDLPPAAQDRIASGDLFFPTADEAAAFDSIVKTGKRKLPWRYKWPEATHDEVLARLLDLNQQRHLEEVRGHKAAKSSNKAARVKDKRSKKAQSQGEIPTIPGMEV